MRSRLNIGAFFDLDGLILDSEPLQLQATNKALESIRVQISSDEWCDYVGSPTIANLRRIVEDTGAEVDVHELELVKNAAYQDLCETHLTTRPGIERLVRDLDEAGFLLAVVTSSVLVDAEQLLDRFGLHRYFDAIVAGDHVARGKPAPDPYLLACQTTGLPANRCIALEDSHNGVVSAVLAGLACVAVPNLFTRGQDLSAAHLLVDDFGALSGQRLRALVPEVEDPRLGTLAAAGKRLRDGVLGRWLRPPKGSIGFSEGTEPVTPSPDKPAGGIPVRGRETLIASVIERITREEVGVWCCYGFMGVGKSTVIREIGNIAANRLRRPLLHGSCPMGPSLCEILELVTGIDAHGKDQWVRLQSVADGLRDTIVVLDTFPHADEDANQQLVWLLSQLGAGGIRCFFVLAAQERPHVTDSAIECVELPGIQLAPFTAYCADLCLSSGRQPLTPDQVAELHEKTGGNPQYARMAIRNTPTGDPKIPLEEIESRVWSRASPELRSVLRTLAALHHFEPEVPEGELAGIIHGWSDRRLELVNGCLDVPARPSKFKTHDLINTYVRHHDEAGVTDEHRKLAQFYANHSYFDSEPRPARLAAGHCAESRAPAAYAEHYLRVAERLRSMGEAKDLQKLADAGFRLGRGLAPEVSEAIRADLGWALAQMGETERALALLTELLNDLNLSASREPDRARRRATLMRQIADCRRLRGNVEDAERELHDAAKMLEQHGLGDCAEAIACLLDHAHCAYLAADPDASLERLNAIAEQYPGKFNQAEWWYRRSKAERLRWDLPDALSSARRAQKYARSDLGITQGRWAELAAERLLVTSENDMRWTSLLTKAEEIRNEFAEVGYRAAIFLDHDIADLYRMAGRHTEALQHFQDTQKLTAAMGETNREAHSWLGIAETVRTGRELGKVGGAEHLDAYREARDRYTAMQNAWGIAISSLGENLARGADVRDIAPKVLAGSCCRGELQLLMTSASTVFPLNLV